MIPDLDVLEALLFAARGEAVVPRGRGSYRQRLRASARAFLSGRYGKQAAARVDFDRVLSLKVGVALGAGDLLADPLPGLTGASARAFAIKRELLELFEELVRELDRSKRSSRMSEEGIEGAVERLQEIASQVHLLEKPG